MMYIQRSANLQFGDTASLACVIISLTSTARLSLPVRAVIVRMSSPPYRIIVSRPVLRLPSPKACTIAKHHFIRLHFPFGTPNILAAVCARSLNPFTCLWTVLAFVEKVQAFVIANARTEMHPILRFISCPLPLKSNSADRTHQHERPSFVRRVLSSSISLRLMQSFALHRAVVKLLSRSSADLMKLIPAIGTYSIRWKLFVVTRGAQALVSNLRFSALQTGIHVNMIHLFWLIVKSTGTGSVPVSCVMTGRQFYAGELVPERADEARARLASTPTPMLLRPERHERHALMLEDAA
jgi:hypothetical protein